MDEATRELQNIEEYQSNAIKDIKNKITALEKKVEDQAKEIERLTKKLNDVEYLAGSSYYGPVD